MVTLNKGTLTYCCNRDDQGRDKHTLSSIFLDFLSSYVLINDRDLSFHTSFGSHKMNAGSCEMDCFCNFPAHRALNVQKRLINVIKHERALETQ